MPKTTRMVPLEDLQRPVQAGAQVQRARQRLADVDQRRQLADLVAGGRGLAVGRGGAGVGAVRMPDTKRSRPIIPATRLLVNRVGMAALRRTHGRARSAVSGEGGGGAGRREREDRRSQGTGRRRRTELTESGAVAGRLEVVSVPCVTLTCSAVPPFSSHSEARRMSGTVRMRDVLGRRRDDQRQRRDHLVDGDETEAQRRRCGTRHAARRPVERLEHDRPAMAGAEHVPRRGSRCG